MSKLIKEIDKLAVEILTRHSEILDDFCKAYLAEIFPTRGFKPSDMKLIQQYQGDKVVWFFEPLTDKDGQSIKQIRDEAKLEGVKEVLDLIYDELEGDCNYVKEMLNAKYNLNTSEDEQVY